MPRTLKKSAREMAVVLAGVQRKEAARADGWLAERLALLPARWSAHVGIEHARRGGLAEPAANRFALDVTEAGRGRVKLSASDEDLRAAAIEAAGDCRSLAEFAALRGLETARAMMGRQCKLWGIEPAKVAGHGGEMPAIRRMCCARWWLRRLRRAHGRRCDGAAIRAGVVRRGLWPYASQDAVERRGEQRRRNQRALDGAVVSCDATGEVLQLAEVVAGSIANPEVKRSELMVRIKGCDAIAAGDGLVCEFWTLTAPSRFHAHKHITKRKTEPNQHYDGSTPKDAQGYISSVWARARAAWKRRGLAVYGLRTAEPHHDGCPHWHLICYGTARDVRFARRLLRVYALRESPDEPGARRHRFVYLKAKKGRYGAAYAAKYISKNINGEGMGAAGDGEAGRKVSDSIKRVDAWASTWGIRQFQFFGTPAISIWRALRKISGPVAVVGSMLERARAAADDSDFAEFWRCTVRGGLSLIYRQADCLTAYGDAAAARIAGVAEGARRALLPAKDWVISWKGGKEKGADGLAVAFDLPRSCVNNCTRRMVDRFEDAAAAVFSVAGFEKRLMRQ
ncbi:MAG: replication endonuclease [Microbacteriaceae bacterium]